MDQFDTPNEFFADSADSLNDQELFEQEMQEEGRQADIDERVKHIPVEYQHGEGSDELVRDVLCTTHTRLIWCPF